MTFGTVRRRPDVVVVQSNLKSIGLQSSLYGSGRPTGRSAQVGSDWTTISAGRSDAFTKIGPVGNTGPDPSFLSVIAVPNLPTRLLGS